MKEGKWALKSTISYTWIIQHGVELQTEPACTKPRVSGRHLAGWVSSLCPAGAALGPYRLCPVLPPSTEIREGSSCNLTYNSSGISRDACSLVHLQGSIKLRMLSVTSSAARREFSVCLLLKPAWGLREWGPPGWWP